MSGLVDLDRGPRISRLIKSQSWSTVICPCDPLIFPKATISKNPDSYHIQQHCCKSPTIFPRSPRDSRVEAERQEPRPLIKCTASSRCVSRRKGKAEETEGNVKQGTEGERKSGAEVWFVSRSRVNAVLVQEGPLPSSWDLLAPLKGRYQCLPRDLDSAHLEIPRPAVDKRNWALPLFLRASSHCRTQPRAIFLSPRRFEQELPRGLCIFNRRLEPVWRWAFKRREEPAETRRNPDHKGSVVENAGRDSRYGATWARGTMQIRDRGGSREDLLSFWGEKMGRGFCRVDWWYWILGRNGDYLEGLI